MIAVMTSNEGMENTKQYKGFKVMQTTHPKNNEMQSPRKIGPLYMPNEFRIIYFLQNAESI